jgi:hypothetical protein
VRHPPALRRAAHARHRSDDLDADQLAAVYQSHLDKMKEVADRKVAWHVSIHEEALLEMRITAPTERMNAYIAAAFGNSAAEFGISP